MATFAMAGKHRCSYRIHMDGPLLMFQLKRRCKAMVRTGGVASLCQSQIYASFEELRISSHRRIVILVKVDRYAGLGATVAKHTAHSCDSPRLFTTSCFRIRSFHALCKPCFLGFYFAAFHETKKFAPKVPISCRRLNLTLEVKLISAF